MEEKILQDVEFIEFLDGDQDLAVVNLLLMHTGENRNRAHYSKEAIIEAIPSFYNRPIIYQLNHFGNDVKAHNNSVFDSTMNICGIIPESSPYEFVERDGREYLQMKGIIYKIYQPKVIKILERRNDNLKISTELMAIDHETINGIKHIHKFKFIGVAMLGENIKEGIEGSTLNVLKYSTEQLNQKFETFSATYEVPTEIKENIKHGLLLRNQYKRGGKRGMIGFVKDLLDKETVSHSDLQYLETYIDKHSYEMVEGDVPTTEYITMLMCGGEQGKTWVSNILNNKFGVVAPVVDNEVSTVVETELENTELNKEEDTMEENKILENNDVQPEAEVVEPTVLKSEFDTLAVKNSELETEIADLKNQLQVFLKKEMTVKNKEMLDKFAHCFTAEEVAEFEKYADEKSFDEIEELVKNKAMDFALNSIKEIVENAKADKMKEDDDEDDDEKDDEDKEEEIEKNQFSVGLPIVETTKENKTKTLADVHKERFAK